MMSTDFSKSTIKDTVSQSWRLIAAGLTGGVMALLIAGCDVAGAAPPAPALPDPVSDMPLAAGATQSAVFAGGCFWGVQAVFQHVNGVIAATSGYAGGAAKDADYETVSSGRTGHAESVKVDYDPSQISYGQLLKIFFTVAHDPTQLNRQGPDRGTQYRSALFFDSAEQQRIATQYVEQLNKSKIFDGSIVTQIVPDKGFYPAEGYHQDYARLHPENPYIAINDLPKVDALKSSFPSRYRAQPVTTSPMSLSAR